jgi:hypothetical protein
MGEHADGLFDYHYLRKCRHDGYLVSHVQQGMQSSTVNQYLLLARQMHHWQL